MKVFENAFAKIAKALFGGKFRGQLKKLEKMTDDPTLKSHIKNGKYYADELDKAIELYCKRNPDDYDICTKKGRADRSGSRVYDVKY